MPLHINLLHEEQAKIVQRQRDPLKLGVMLLLFIGLALFGYYFVRSLQSGKLAKQAAGMTAELKKLEPQAVKAKADQEKASSALIATTNIEKMINGRFYWGPVLAKVVNQTGPEIQITRLDGVLVEATRNVKLIVSGISAGAEPRAVAERFRQQMGEAMKSFGVVTSQFASLENNDAKIAIQDKTLDTALMTIEFNIQLPPPGPIPNVKTE